MLGRLLKAVAGCVLGGMVGYFIGKYAGLGTTYGGIALSDLVSVAVLGVIAYAVKGKETVGTVFIVATAFQIAAIVIKLIATVV